MKFRPATEADWGSTGRQASSALDALEAALRTGPQVVLCEEGETPHHLAKRLRQWGYGQSRRPRLRARQLLDGTGVLVSLQEPRDD